MTPRYGEPPQSGRRYRMRPGVYALLPRDGALLVTFQQDPLPEYQMPGGGIDPGESPITALHREVFEETGWRIAAPRRLGVFRRFTFMPDYDLWAEKICTLYVAHPVHPLGPPTEPGHTALWMDPSAALSLLSNEGERDFLQRYLR
ncbi:NUDIX hydrolase [Salipiger marinus]|jgi:8-oxo-dGTP diphosphatase|uniref:8-oxo-dGTP diphosphatase n=1 Tax=Salipiger marinus TaxID=555512 RepID=A0A1G8NGE0_9RHOB|nr:MULTISPECIES: NUDIX hydrolase [Salipiger]HBM59985.1 NUDIX domain-containing protein [Citreicella sp.]MCD1617342.1 NUDIX hydrolase [Salipiger manganoxidans]MEB3417396.1 NUDIX hydrolase [Salipiger manganoxidans]SDI79157.1 8-oxo-dGTP diphosphatase [Salipiger marinus]HBS99050.1 NUDIX domain-containing protein [Citreicella sp.]